VDKSTIKGVLAKYSPPLSPSQMDEIAEAIMTAHLEDLKRLRHSKRKSSKSQNVTGSKRGRTR